MGWITNLSWSPSSSILPFSSNGWVPVVHTLWIIQGYCHQQASERGVWRPVSFSKRHPSGSYHTHHSDPVTRNMRTRWDIESWGFSGVGWANHRSITNFPTPPAKYEACNIKLWCKRPNSSCRRTEGLNTPGNAADTQGFETNFYTIYVYIYIYMYVYAYIYI